MKFFLFVSWKCAEIFSYKTSPTQPRASRVKGGDVRVMLAMLESGEERRGELHNDGEESGECRVV